MLYTALRTLMSGIKSNDPLGIPHAAVRIPVAKFPRLREMREDHSATVFLVMRYNRQYFVARSRARAGARRFGIRT